jgi:hypothetical protein
MIIYFFLGSVLLTFLCISLFFTRFLLGGKRYAEKGTMEYEKLTLGNPLAALFIDRVLTRQGLQLRSSMVISIGAIWALCFIVAIIVTNA